MVESFCWREYLKTNYDLSFIYYYNKYNTYYIKTVGNVFGIGVFSLDILELFRKKRGVYELFSDDHFLFLDVLCFQHFLRFAVIVFFFRF